MKSIFKFFPLVFLAGTVLMLTGCGDGEETLQKAGDYFISLKSNPDPPTVGLNLFEAKITDASGAPVTGAAIHLHFSMPAMAGMSAMASETEMQETGKGKYRAEIDLGSGGQFPWDVRMEVLQGEQVLTVTQWQVTPGTKGIKFVSGESSPAGSGGEVDYYTCTMHPSVKDSDPDAKCPICAMNLTPVYKSGSQPVVESGGVTGQTGSQVKTVNIPLYKQQLIGVQLDTVKSLSMDKKIRTVGHVDYDETRIAVINLKFSGWLEELYADHVGQFVKKGQPLFSIYSPELVATQEELLQVLPQSTAESSKPDPLLQSLYQTAKERLLLWGLSEAQVEEIAQSRQPKLRITYYSPFTGYIIEKNALLGEQAKAGMNLYKIADLSRVWVYADIYESELSFIKTGQSAGITSPYNPEMSLTGKVDYIYPTIDNKTRTGKVRLVFANPGLHLKPDMYANVEIAVQSGERLVIPETAVLNTGKRQIVFVARGSGKFEPREIKTGVKAERFYTVLEGLQAGEVVVKSGNFLIDAEAHVQGVIQTMNN